MSASPATSETLAAHFAAAINAFIAREGCRNPLQPVESEILNMAMAVCSERPFGQDVRELLQAAARQMTKQSLDGNIRGIIEGVGAHCESALDLALCLAICVAARAE